jgi:hypothetical protein
MFPSVRKWRAGITLVATIFLLTGLSYGATSYLYDIMGRYLGEMQDNHHLSNMKARLLSDASILSFDGKRRDLPAGIYISSPFPSGEISPMDILDEFRFENVTQQYLPQHQWDAGAAAIADLNGDGLPDIVFSISPLSYDSLADYRPRTWMQQADHRFIDESEARVPAVSTPSSFLKLFDADSDGDFDIFVTGYGRLTHHVHACLFINDGTGHFTDESSTRLPQLSGEDFVYAVDAADVNNDHATDIVVNIWSTENGIYPIAPQLWLNDGSGNFTIDTMGRMPIGDYGYFIPYATDIDHDSLADIIFANMQFIITDEMGNPIDTVYGQNACYHNLGDGFFADETASRMPADLNPNTRTMAFSDINNDGYSDLLEVAYLPDAVNPQVRLLLNDGSGDFTFLPNAISDSVRGWFNDSQFGLLNGDPFPDLFMPRVEPGEPDYDVLLVNNGGTMFADSSQLLPQIYDFSVSSALFDHELDGDLDIFAANANIGETGGQNVLYHNLLNPVGVIGDAPSSPASFFLMPNYPNPFNARTVISYNLSERSDVTLDIYDLLGRRIGTLLSERQKAGPHSVVWDARDRSSGIYYYCLKAGDLRQSRRCLLIK